MCRENSDLEKRIGQAKLDRRETRGNWVTVLPVKSSCSNRTWLSMRCYGMRYEIDMLRQL
ncbi:hypothetical protein [Streptococcus suis]